jgi:hypothetical protein
VTYGSDEGKIGHRELLVGQVHVHFELTFKSDKNINFALGGFSKICNGLALLWPQFLRQIQPIQVLHSF